MSKYTEVTLDQNVQDQDPEETEAGKYGKLGLIWWCWTILQKKIVLNGQETKHGNLLSALLSASVYRVHHFLH